MFISPAVPTRRTVIFIALVMLVLLLGVATFLDREALWASLRPTGPS
jgi:hypothetical protein